MNLFKYRSKLFYTLISPVRIFRFLFRQTIINRAYRYLEQHNVLNDLAESEESEVIPVYIDLANMHRLVKKNQEPFWSSDPALARL